MIEVYISLLCLLKALDMLTSAELHIHRMNVLKAQHRLEPRTTIVLTGRGNGNVSRGNLFNNLALFFGAAIILLLLGWMIFSYLKRRSVTWLNSYQMDDGDLLDNAARHRKDILAFEEEECCSSQMLTTEDDEDDSEEEETVEDNEDSEMEETEEQDEGSEKDETMEDNQDSEEDEAMEDIEVSEEEETVEDDSEEEETREEEDVEEEEEETMEDEKDSEEEEKAEEKDDRNEFLEILWQFITDPSGPTEFPRPSLLLCDPRRNQVYEAVLRMRRKLDRLERDSESLEKERLDHLNMIEELQIETDMEEDLNDIDIEKEDGTDQLLKEKVEMENERREKELEDKVKILTEEVARLNERRTVGKEEEPSEVHKGTDAAKLQRIIDRQADQIKHLRKKLLEMEEDRRRRELDFQEWEKTVHTVTKENSELKVALEDLDRKNGLFTIFEERNKVLEEQAKELRRQMVDSERKKEKEKRSILKETETLRTQMNEAFTVRDVVKNEMESMALQIQKLECENKNFKKDVGYFEEWFVKDYANHCEDVEDCLGKMFEVSDRHQLLLKEKLKLMRNTRDSEEV